MLKCLSTKSDKILIPCLTSGVGYSLNCETCIDREIIKVYEGENGRAALIQGMEHERDLRRENQTVPCSNTKKMITQMKK